MPQRPVQVESLSVAAWRGVRLAVGQSRQIAVPADVRLWPGENKAVPFRRGHELQLTSHPTRSMVILDVEIDHERALRPTMPRASGENHAGHFWWVLTVEIVSVVAVA